MNGGVRLRQTDTAHPLCLLDVITAVQDSSSDDREALAALRDFLAPSPAPTRRRRPPVRRGRALLRAVTLLCAVFLVTRGALADETEMEAPEPGVPPEQTRPMSQEE